MKKLFNQFGSELSSIVRNRKVLIPVMAVLLVPVLYSAMFLGAFWDPYAKLVDLPVAIVNADKGTEFNGKSLHIGDEFVAKLKEKPQFKWEFVSNDEAIAGMEDNKYYMTIRIPDDFSEKTTTLTSDNPTPAQFVYLPNESYNFLASQIGNTAVEQMKQSLNKEIIKTYTQTVFEQVGQLADGIGQASEGASSLADGTSKAKDGVNQIEQNLNKLVAGTLTLKEGVAKLETGSDKLDQGGAQLSGGVNDLASGLTQLQEAQQKLGAGATSLGAGAEAIRTGSQNLSGGLSQLAQGSQTLVSSSDKAEQASKQLAASLDQSEAGAAKLVEAATQLSKGLEELAQKNTGLEQDANFLKLQTISKQLAEGITGTKTAQEQLGQAATQLNVGLGQLKSGLSTFDGKLKEASAGGQQLAVGGKSLADGAKQWTEGMTLFGGKLLEAKDGSQALATGAKELTKGNSDLHKGLTQLKTSVNPFVEGSVQLKDGTQQIASGLFQLDDGMHELSSKLSDAKSETSKLNVSDSMYDMFAEPVQSDVQKVNEVPNYGTGFAPYFLSLGLYVGALIITIVYSVREPAVRPSSGVNWFWSKALTLITAGTIQALIADAAILWILKMDVMNIPLFMLFSILISVTFMMLIQVLVTTLQNPGRFIAIVILIFQLTSSAGTFPLELLPNWLQKVTPWLPMTYSVAGLKDVISSGDYTSMWRNAAILGVFTVIFASISLIYFVVVNRNAKSQKLEAAVASN